MQGKGGASHEQAIDVGRMARTLVRGLCGVLVFDRQGSCVYANQAAASIYGLPAAGLRGTNFGVFLADALVGSDPSGSDGQSETDGDCEITTPAGERRRVLFEMHANFVPGLHMAIVREGPPLRREEMGADGRESLSAREREILGLLASGLTGEEIALRLDLSPTTVQTHVRNAMRKLGAGTRTHAVVLALAANEL